MNTVEALVEVHRMKGERAKKDDMHSLERLLTLVKVLRPDTLVA